MVRSNLINEQNDIKIWSEFEMIKINNRVMNKSFIRI